MIGALQVAASIGALGLGCCALLATLRSIPPIDWRAYWAAEFGGDCAPLPRRPGGVDRPAPRPVAPPLPCPCCAPRPL